jgi:lysophospholipase L1-like esterase
VNIVCHGHSVPAGYAQSPEVRGLESYPHLLHVALRESFPTAVVNVIVSAKGGEPSDAGAARFKHDVLSHHPDLVTIDYSLNDLNIGLEAARAAWGSMIEDTLGFGAKALLLTPTHDLRAESLNTGEAIASHAAQVRMLASSHGIGLADSDRAFHNYLQCGGKLEDLMADNNHPNLAGHRLVFGELWKWFDVVRSNPMRSTTPSG